MLSMMWVLYIYISYSVKHASEVDTVISNGLHWYGLKQVKVHRVLHQQWIILINTK